MSGLITATVVTGVAGSALAAKGARSAARTQSESADAAIVEQRRASEQARSDLQPFRQAGEEALDPLLQFVQQGPETEFERTQGFEAIQKSAAAGGTLSSGETLKALTEFNTGLNQRFRTQRFNELFNIANLGQSAAAGQANIGIAQGENVSSLLVGQGNVRAAGQAGAASAIGGGLEQAGSFLGTLAAKRQNNLDLSSG